MTKYQVNTTLTDGTQIESGTIVIPDATIPIANSTTLGGVMPVTKTDGMTQEVGVDSTGKLFTAPGGGGGGGGGATITCNNQNVETLDLTNVTFQPRYEVESTATVNISPNNSVKWDPVKVTGTNVLGNWISASNSLIELGMGNSADITLTKSTDSTNGEYLQWVLSQDIKDDIAGKQDTLVSGTNIKTINGNSLLGSGDLTISGGGSNIQIYHGYKFPANGSTTIDLFPSNYDLSANYIIMFVTWHLTYEGFSGRYYNTKFTYGYDNSLSSQWDVYDPEVPDKKPSLNWQNWFGANDFYIDSAGATASIVDIVAISIPKTS